MSKRKRKKEIKIEVERRQIDRRWLCPIQNCLHEEHYLSRIKRHIEKCYFKNNSINKNEVTLLICEKNEKDVLRKTNFSSMVSPVKRIKTKRISKNLKNDEDLSNLVCRIEKESGLSYDEIHKKKIQQLQNEINKLKLEKQQQQDIEPKFNLLLQKIKNPLVPPFDSILDHMRYELQKSKHNDGKNQENKINFAYNVILLILNLKMKNPPSFSKKEIAKQIYELNRSEELLVWNEITDLLKKIDSNDKKSIIEFGIPEKRDNTTIEIDSSQLNNDDYVEKKFSEFMTLMGKVSIRSSDQACHSGQDVVDHRQKLKELFREQIILWMGDQPVYEAQRRENHFAAPGKFHIQLNVLRGIFKVIYQSKLEIIQKQFFKQQQKLEEIPQGFYKISEKLFLNFFILCWQLLVTIYKTTLFKLKEKNINISNITFFNFIQLHKENWVFVNIYKSCNLFSFQFLSDLFKFCTEIGFSFYLLRKSIKTNNYKLYIISIKYMLRYLRAFGNENYFRILTLHLYDIFFKWSTESVEFFKMNLVYISTSNNLIPFDEVTEIENKKQKPSNKGKQPIKKLQELSDMSCVTDFLKQIDAPKTHYTKLRYNTGVHNCIGLLEGIMLKTNFNLFSIHANWTKSTTIANLEHIEICLNSSINM